MKINKLLLLFFALSLTGCSTTPTNHNPGDDSGSGSDVNPGGGTEPGGNTDPEPGGNTDPGGSTDPDPQNPGTDPNQGGTDDPGEITTNKRMQDTPILHCWNWSMNTISNNLQSIKDAGFKTIQLSPMQPQKDYYQGHWRDQWWKLYQPLGFTISSQSNQNVLGTKSELTSLCSKAKSMGIDVIMDVVANHLAGGSQTSLNGSVNNYEHDIYSQNLIHGIAQYVNDNSIKGVTQYTIGDYPDLKTETTTVQNRVLSLLKEYIDCGVNGFRFDAAKHIETPDDGEYASNFWPTVLNGTTTYANSKGLDNPYYYGEILYQCGSGRNWSSYTKYMSVTDSSLSGNVRKAVVNKNAATAASSTYTSTLKGENVVLWAESHDNYATSNDSQDKSTNVSIEDINKAYMIQTSKKDATTLYFARPGNGNIGTIGDLSYKNKEIKAINEFHTMFVNKKETISSNNGCFVNVRGTSGAAIINIADSSTNKTVLVSGLANGTYKDLVSGSSFVVNNGSVNAKFTNNACILVNENATDLVVPSISVNYKEVYKDTQTLTITSKNTTKLTYSINNGTETALTGSTIELPNSLANGRVSVKFKASNDNGSVTKEINMVKTTALINKSLIIYDSDISNYDIACWVWKDNGQGSWKQFEKEGTSLGLDMGDNNKFIIVTFNKGAKVDWSNKVKQSEDISFTNRVYDYKALIS